MRKLVLSNSYAIKLGTFKNVLSDPATAPLNDKTLFSQELPGASSNSLFIDVLTAIRLQNSKKKKAKDQTIFEKLSTAKKSVNTPQKPPTPLLVAIKLIRPDKQRVQVLVNIVKSTFPKRM